MKSPLYLLFAALVPTSLLAQPMLTVNEYYRAGDVITMRGAATSGITAGASGPSTTWDYSALTPSGPTYTTTVATDTSTIFSTANLMMTTPDGHIWHLRESSSDTYVEGMYDPSTTTTTYYSGYTGYHTSKRPFGYNSNFADTFAAVVAGYSHGTGYISAVGDAYGTLKLPTGDYTNVVRVRKQKTQTDTLTSGSTYSTLTISYQWFDAGHNAPLLQMDSVLGGSGSSFTVSYLTAPTGLKSTSSFAGSANAWFRNNELVVSGLSGGGNYEVAIMNIIGSKIYTADFSGGGSMMRFDIGSDLLPGIYIVAIQEKGNPSTREVLKVVKQ